MMRAGWKSAKHKRPMRVRRTAWLLSGALLIAGCTEPAPLKDDEFRWVNQVDAPTLDPHASTNGFVLGILSNVYEPLVRLNKDLKLEPSLAVRWEMVSPTRWRFHLRQGVRFHDGGAFNADDVIFSLRRVGDEHSILRDRVGMISEIIRIDDHTVDVVTHTPNPILPALWSRLYIMDKEWAAKHGALRPSSAALGVENFASRNENGSGPYRITAREQEVRTVFQRFGDWWDAFSNSAPQTVVLKPVANSGTRIATLLSGDADLISPLSIQDIRRIRGRQDLDLLIHPELRVIFLGFDQFRTQGLGTNVHGNPFRDARVRRAVSLAIDRKAIREKLMYGLTEPVSTLIAPALFEPAATLAVPAHDPAEARRLLSEAGYPRGFETKFLCTNDRYVNDGLLCQAIVSMLARVGINARLQTIPVNQYGKMIGRPLQAFGLYLQGWVPVGLDPYNILFNIMGSFDPETGRGNTNYGDFSDPEIDRLTALAEGELNPAARDRFMLDAFKRMNENSYYVPLHAQPVIWAGSKRFTVTQRADDTLFFPDIRTAD